MFNIKCPWCGERYETEFVCAGEPVPRPLDPERVSASDWGDYLFMRKNPKGKLREQWFHAYGCRKWFIADRDTVSYEILATKPLKTYEGK